MADEYNEFIVLSRVISSIDTNIKNFEKSLEDPSDSRPGLSRENIEELIIPLLKRYRVGIEGILMLPDAHKRSGKEALLQLMCFFIQERYKITQIMPYAQKKQEQELYLLDGLYTILKINLTDIFNEISGKADNKLEIREGILRIQATNDYLAFKNFQGVLQEALMDAISSNPENIKKGTQVSNGPKDRKQNNPSRSLPNSTAEKINTESLPNKPTSSQEEESGWGCLVISVIAIALLWVIASGRMPWKWVLPGVGGGLTYSLFLSRKQG